MILEFRKKSYDKLFKDLRRQLEERDKIIVDQSLRIKEFDDQAIDVEMWVGWGFKCDAISKGYPTFGQIYSIL